MKHTIFGRKATKTITPGGFTATKRRLKPRGYWEKPREVNHAADRAILVYQRTVRVQ